MADARHAWGRRSGRTSAMLKAALLRAREGQSVLVAVHSTEMREGCREMLRALGATEDDLGRVRFTTSPERDRRGRGWPVFRDHMYRG